MCPHSSERAVAMWGKACNFHKGFDPDHICGNPAACERTLAKALAMEMQYREFVRKWA